MAMKRKKAKKRATKEWRTPHVAIRTVDVDNPAWRPDLDGEKGIPRRMPAVVNVKESAIETLYARKHLSTVEKLAADQFRAWWEAYSRQHAQAIDYSRDRVSSSKAPVPVTEAQIAARESLQRARQLLGLRGFDLLQKICGEGRSLQEIGRSNRERTTAADNLRMHLNDLARDIGLWTSGPTKVRRHRGNGS